MVGGAEKERRNSNSRVWLRGLVETASWADLGKGELQKVYLSVSALCAKERCWDPLKQKMGSFKSQRWAQISCIQQLLLSWTKSLLSYKAWEQSQGYLRCGQEGGNQTGGEETACDFRSCRTLLQHNQQSINNIRPPQVLRSCTCAPFLHTRLRGTEGRWGDMGLAKAPSGWARDLLPLLFWELAAGLCLGCLSWALLPLVEDKHLIQHREAEIWEPGSVLNRSDNGNIQYFCQETS